MPTMRERPLGGTPQSATEAPGSSLYPTLCPECRRARKENRQVLVLSCRRHRIGMATAGKEGLQQEGLRNFSYRKHACLDK